MKKLRKQLIMNYLLINCITVTTAKDFEIWCCFVLNVKIRPKLCNENWVLVQEMVV